jgi:hypothetical protein
VLQLNILTNVNWVAVTNAPEKKIYHIKKQGNITQNVEGSVQSQIENGITSDGQEFITENDLDWMLLHFMNLNVIKIYEFEPTELLPTYLYTINAGPYRIYEHKNTNNGSPP